MKSFFKKAALSAAMSATALVSAAPAMADPYGDSRHRNNGDTAGAAVVGGIIGLTIGALLASAGNKHNRCDGDRRCYRGDNRYYQGAYNDGYYADQRQQGGYYNRDGRYYDPNGNVYEENGRYRNYDNNYDDRQYSGDD